MVTLPAFGWISNSRSTADCSTGEPSGAVPPSRTVSAAPAPVIVSGPAMS
jgi:hypothetical protein